MRFLIIILLLLPFDAASQTTQRSSPKDPAKTNQVLHVIRQDALSAANQIIDEISMVEDFASRVVIAEKTVRLLSKERPERCRKMLNEIFEDAMALKSDPSKAKSIPPDLDSILIRIIQAAAVVDLGLADHYVEALSNSKEIDTTTKHRTLSSASVYLRIATDLTRTDPSLAVSVATRTLAINIPPEMLVFLAILREHAPVLADRFFITAVQSRQKRGAKDINELLLLYSYVFSPRRVPMVSSQGIGVLSIPGYSEIAKDYGVNAALARQYITVVGEIFLDPNRYTRSNIETLALGIEGDFYGLSIIEPFITTYLPSLTAKIMGQRNVLASYLLSCSVNRCGRPHLHLIALLGVIVPRRLRADWRHEWEAELQHRELLLAEWDRLDWRNKLNLLRRSTKKFSKEPSGVSPSPDLGCSSLELPKTTINIVTTVS